jgi:hypothetical protein
MENYTIIEGDNIDLAIQYYTMKKEGKEVVAEYYTKHLAQWVNPGFPSFRLGYKHRLLIPKEKKLTPFDYTDNLIGMVVEEKTKDWRGVIVSQDIDGVYVGIRYCRYDALLDNFTTYPTGTPCGNEEVI